MSAITDWAAKNAQGLMTAGQSARTLNGKLLSLQLYNGGDRSSIEYLELSEALTISNDLANMLATVPAHSAAEHVAADVNSTANVGETDLLLPGDGVLGTSSLESLDKVDFDEEPAATALGSEGDDKTAESETDETKVE